MSTKLKEIHHSFSSHFSGFNKVFNASIQSHIPLLETIMKFIVKRKGKQMRPLFVFLAADICGTINEKSYRAASLIELLHTATLIHDDVVDEAERRRSFFSVNALWNNKAAVLVGDFLLSRGLLLSLDNDDFSLLKIVSKAVREMSEGELLQIEKARDLNVKESVYFEIIKKKTASLIASCCACGAASVDASKEYTDKMYKLGENIGICFQMRDDLFDYEKMQTSGKPSGIDIKEKKLTLPLIYMLNNMNFAKRRYYIYQIKNHNNDAEKMNEILNEVNNSGGIEYTKTKMNEFKERSFELLNDFPDCKSRSDLRELINFTVERKY